VSACSGVRDPASAAHVLKEKYHEFTLLNGMKIVFALIVQNPIATSAIYCKGKTKKYELFIGSNPRGKEQD
jgi:hypothetical protein